MNIVAELFVMTRNRMPGLLESVSADDWYTVPDGFSNNLAWNVGHLVFATHALIYARSGLEGHYSMELAKMYGAGTSPADWASKPDSAELLHMLTEQPKQLTTDAASGMFDTLDFTPWAMGDNMISSARMAASYNLHHEGFHMGVVTSLVDAMKQ